VVVAVLLVLLGRYERQHEQASVVRHIAAVRAAIGPSLTRPGPDNYVYNPGRSCLLYSAGGRSYALELCVDAQGRVVEAVDRRGLSPHFYSLVEEPGAARLHIDPALVASLIKRIMKS